MIPTDLLESFLSYLDGVADPLARDFAAEIPSGMPARDLEARALPCLRHLPRSVEIAPEAERVLSAELASDAPALHWGQTYAAADFGAAFLESYGWMELFGARGHFACERIAGGFLLLGPDIVYPDHHHLAEEIYIPLTPGTEWRMAGRPFALRSAGEIIHHASDVPHAMRTGREPLLALYLWRGGPLAQRSTIVDL